MKIIIKKLLKKDKFTNSADYWEKRYAEGGNSGVGSYNEIAEFKAKIINQFVSENDISTIIEFGSGDGNQLSYANYKNYIGLDVSPTSIRICQEKFKEDKTKSFFLYNSLSFFDNHSIFKAELTMSLDVIYHLVEDNVFNNYMKHLFDAAKKFVIIYSDNNNSYGRNHVKNRKFTDWVDENAKDWKLQKKIKNEVVTWQDFYIFEKNKK